jgi:hypothetical protein
MDEARILRKPAMARVRDNLALLIETLAGLDHAAIA